MRLTLLIILSVLINETGLLAQNVIWAEKMGFVGGGNDGGYEIVADDSGYIYVTGFLKNASYAGPIYLADFGEHDLMTAKYDVQGNIQWAKRHGSSLSDQNRSLTLDEDGNVYTFGYFDGTCDFGNGLMITPSGTRDAVIVKYDPNGNIIWTTVFEGGWAGFYNAGSMSINYLDGKLFVGGCFYDSITIGSTTYQSAGLEDMFLATLDSSGQVLTSKHYGNTKDDLFRNMIVTPEGKIVMSLTTSGAINVGTISYNNSATTSDDALLIGMDTAYNVLWHHSFGGEMNQRISGVVAQDNGNIYVTGIFRDTLAVDQNLYNLTSIDISDGFIMKLNNAGTITNFKTFGGQMREISNSIVLNNENDRLYLSGWFEQEFIIGTDTFIANSPREQMILCVDTLLDLQWFNQYDGLPQSGKVPSIADLTVDQCGYIYFTGNFRDTIDFDGVNMIASGSGLDVITGKMNPQPRVILNNQFLSECNSDSISVTADFPCSISSWIWNFPGSVEGSSTLSNPTIHYLNNGVYDAEVIISDGYSTDTLHLPNYLSIGELFFTLGADTIVCDSTPFYLDASQSFASYDWSTGDLGSNILVDTTGLYWVTVTDTNGCSSIDSIHVTVTNCTSVDEFNFADFQVYPNPTTNSFRISFDGKFYSQSEVFIYDLAGKMVFRDQVEPNKTFRISNINPGTYILYLENENINFAPKKLMISR